MSIPAGWYADGTDPTRMRWWDGSTWTEHTARAADNPTAPPGVRPSSASVATAETGSGAASISAEIDALRRERDQLRASLIETRDAALLQEVGLYEFHHPLDDSVAYKAALEALQTEMRDAVKRGSAVRGAAKWAINGSDKEGAKMVADFSKLLLRAYNTEADNLVCSMRPYALSATLARLDKMRDSIMKLGRSMSIEITAEYHALRVKELTLTADYLVKLAEERDREREERRRLKEEEQARLEFEREQAKLEKERAHYLAAAEALHRKGDEEAAAAAEAKLTEIGAAIEGVARRAANVRAGYVYIISNIGSFGETVVKIGMTRRLDPLDRVRELGDASVPFRFDVHAIIFSEDAVSLEGALHARFVAQRVNLVNAHREFFFTTPEAVKEALVSLRGDILSFASTPEALEWHQSNTARRKAQGDGGGTVVVVARAPDQALVTAPP